MVKGENHENIKENRYRRAREEPTKREIKEKKKALVE